MPQQGVGYVTWFDLRADSLRGFEVHEAGGKNCREYWIPSEHLDSLNANIVGAIREMAEYRSSVADEEFGAVPYPEEWRRYLKQPSWLRSGWISQECWLRLYGPSDSLIYGCAWKYPGIFHLGEDAAGRRIAIDTRIADPPVVRLPEMSVGWNSLAEFVEQVEKCASVGPDA